MHVQDLTRIAMGGIITILIVYKVLCDLAEGCGFESWVSLKNCMTSDPFHDITMY